MISIIIKPNKIPSDIMYELYVHSLESIALDSIRQKFVFDNDESYKICEELLSKHNVNFEIIRKIDADLRQAVRDGDKDLVNQLINDGADTFCLEKSDFAKLFPEQEESIKQLIIDFLKQKNHSKDRINTLQNTFIKKFNRF